jgi:DnaJ-class molecular chaperone
MLALLTLALPGYSQETGQTGTVEQEAPAKLPAARPKLPNVIIFESSVGNVHFPHKMHRKMGCKKCHHQIHAKELMTPHEEYLGYSWVSCHDCHNNGSDTDGSYYGCDACHHSNLENIADETLSAKVVMHTSCWNCHLSGTGPEASERCSFCHIKE